MSRIEDDGSELRFRDLQEAQAQKRVQEEKRGIAQRLEKSFSEVMSEKGRREAEKQTQSKEQAKDAPKQNVLDKLKQQPSKNPQELARRAAMSRMMQGSLQTQRQAGAQQDEALSKARSEEILNRSIDERDTQEKDVRESETRGERVLEEKEQLVKREAQHEGPVERREDGQRRQQSKDQREEQRPEGVAATSGPKGAAPVQIPKELIDKLVSAIQTAVAADGRTTMSITLKGGMLEGVQLNIQAEKGKVSCELNNCNDQLKKLVKGGQEALKQALGKRGLTLVKLEAKG